ncbi:MAG TPA: hypothetical protein VIJ28_08440 [Chloroflexota bacterium]|jgi:hypothetical protein
MADAVVGCRQLGEVGLQRRAGEGLRPEGTSIARSERNPLRELLEDEGIGINRAVRLAN